MAGGFNMVRAAAGAVMAAGLALAASGAAAEEFSIPLLVDFEAPQYAAFYAFIADKLQGQVADGKLAIESTAASGDCRLSPIRLATPQDVHATYAEVTSTPLDTPGGDGNLLHGAGLVIKHSSEGATRFYAMLVRKGGYDIVAFDNGAIAQRLGGSMPGGAEGPVRIAARETGNGAEFFVDGKRVASLSDSRITGWGVALIHCGAGTYAFDNWGLNSKGDAGLGN